MMSLDPVVDPDGNTYERIDIEKWVKKNHTSPLTRTPLNIDQLYTNRKLKYVVTVWKKKFEYSNEPEKKRAKLF